MDVPAVTHRPFVLVSCPEMQQRLIVSDSLLGEGEQHAAITHDMEMDYDNGGEWVDEPEQRDLFAEFCAGYVVVVVANGLNHSLQCEIER